tara:strand:- start:1146 stop:1346 length:201 start_codon:yes stop_codon:yes gene_type:complete
MALVSFIRSATYDFVMPEVTFINGDCYEIIDNTDCNAPNEYVLMELGPHHSWDEISRIEDCEECPF